MTGFKPGDEVYANLQDHGYGGFAEYVAVPVGVLSSKPANLSFEEAAAVPMAAVTALQGLRRHGAIQPAQQVLINGFTSMRRLLGVSLRGGKDIAQVQAHVSSEDLELLSELIEAGKLRPRIDRRYGFAYLEQGHARAKVVVAMT